MIQESENINILFNRYSEKVEKSIKIIRETEWLYGKNNIGIAWTGGKDSITLLHLVRSAYKGDIPFKVINIDTSAKFKEVYDFRDKVAKEWNLDLVILKNGNAEKIIKSAESFEECCYYLKTKILNEGIRTYGIKALMTGIRWDEHVARVNDKYFSEREEHLRVNPILHFTERDIWEYIKRNDVPYCALYDKGYRSIGCVPCTEPTTLISAERDGRNQDKETIMYKLRSRGYF